MKDNLMFLCMMCITGMLAYALWCNRNPLPNPDYAQMRVDIRDLRSQLYEMQIQSIAGGWQECALKERIIISLLDCEARLYKTDDPLKYREIMTSEDEHTEVLKRFGKL